MPKGRSQLRSVKKSVQYSKKMGRTNFYYFITIFMAIMIMFKIRDKEQNDRTCNILNK